MVKSERAEKTIRSALTVSVIIALSKLAGFAREIVFAAYFGQSLESDAYTTSYTILNIIAIAFGAGIGSTFIPIYTKARLKVGEERAHIYGSYILNLYMLCGLLLSVLGYFFAPQICGLIYQGSQEGLALTVKLTRIMYPTIFCWATVGVLTNILDARKNFIPEQLVGFALTFCVIIACAIFGTIEYVAVATAIAAVLQVIIILPFMRGNFKYKPKLNLKDKDLQRTFVLALPAIISIAFDEINALTDKIFASSLGTGVVTSLAKSFTLVQMVLGVLIVPLTTIMFTELSTYAALGQMNKLKSTVRKSMEMVVLVTLPIIVLAIICSNDIIGVVYQRGNFTAEDTALTAPVFSFYIIGIMGLGLRTFFTKVFYSLQMTKIPMLVGMFSVTLNIVLDLLLMGPMGPKGLTFATSIASLSAAILMLILLHKKIGSIEMKRSVYQFTKMFFAAGVSLIAAVILHSFIPVSETDFSSNLIRLLLSGGIGLAIYLLMAKLMNIEMFERVLSIMKRRLSRKR